MTFDLRATVAERSGEGFRLHSDHLNPQMVKVLRTIGFDRFYERGEGCYLYDREGARYLDLLAGFGVFALGRGHPVVKQALHDALDADFANLVQMDCALLPGLLAEALLARVPPPVDRCFFTNSGAEAVEGAIKFARRATGRTRIVYCDHAFHGLTNGALSVNGGSEFRDGFGPLLPGCVEVPFGDLDALEAELAGGDVAAFIVEPIQGKGVNLPPDEYLAGARQACSRHGALLVIDEVQTGIGRTGRFLALEHWNADPDMITISKALSGGYVPVGALLCRSEIFDRVFDHMERAVIHSSTFGENDLSMVAGLATLHVLDDEGLVERAAATGDAFMAALEPMVDKFELVRAVRGRGLMIGIEFGEPRSFKLRSGWRMMERLRPGLFTQMIVVPMLHRHRILTQVAGDNMNVLKILPPLVAGEEEVDQFVGALEDVVADAHRYPGLAWDFGRTVAKSALKRETV
jgi:acetylornithine/succinyldiaminopimelate/putrescine aminotransferase